mgnify:CR=1 FL=1
MNEYAEYFALIRENDFEGAKAYLAVNPAAANARDNTGVPAALRAMQTGDDVFCRWIIEQSLSKLNETDPDGATALHYAAAKGSPELLRYLVERVGWDPLRGDCKGRTPYGIAHAARNAAGEAYFAEAVGEDYFGCHNTDGHLRSVFFGRSETMTIKDGVLDGGEFAHIYFIDWDHVRARHRQLNVTVMGTTEDVNDRKFHGGQTINTLRKYTDEEKAYDIHYTLQLDAREF